MDNKSKTIESYNKHARHYSEYYKGLLDLNKKTEFLKFIGLLKGEKILDIGGGAGDHALYFKNQGLDVTCIDLSEGMIKICKSKGLNCLLKDVEKLDFEESFFDGVWAVTSLLHVPKANLPNVLKKISKVLKEDGIAMFCVKEGEGETMIVDKHDSETKRFFAFWKKDELTSLLKKDFEIIEIHESRPKTANYLFFFLRKK